MILMKNDNFSLNHLKNHLSNLFNIEPTIKSNHLILKNMALE
jgi:hypothetical protein